MGWVVLQCWLGGMQCGGWAEHRDAPRLCQHLAHFPALLREEKWLKKRLLENKTDEEISSLLSASLQGETLNAGPRRPVAGGAACVQPLGREHFWAGFPSMRCPDVLLRARQDGADLLHLYRPSVG